VTVWIKRTCWTLINRKFRFLLCLTKIVSFFCKGEDLSLHYKQFSFAVFLHGGSVRWQWGHWNGRANDTSHLGFNSEAERHCYPLHWLYEKWWTDRMRGFFRVLIAAARQPEGFSCLMYWLRWKGLALYSGYFHPFFHLNKTELPKVMNRLGFAFAQ